MIGIAALFAVFPVGILVGALATYPIYRWAGGKKSLLRWLKEI